MLATRHPGGISLGGTLLAVAVLAVLAFSLSGVAVTHLQASSRVDHSELALNAARSTVSLAIGRILKSPEMGRERNEIDDVDLVLGESGPSGSLTFHPATAENEGLPLSTNNLRATEQVEGWQGSPVPAGTTHLVARGRSGGVNRTVEVILRLPPFPWAIASGGQVSTESGVLVGALPEGAEDLPSDLSKLGPADLVANGDQPDAVVLQNESLITGDVETPGQVQLGAGQVEVKGEVRSGSSPVSLRTLDPTDYDPKTRGLECFPLESGNVAEIVGAARAERSVTFPGPLRLNQACLYVVGDLRLLGGVSGHGVLIATGNIEISGGAAMTSPTDMALLAGGLVRLRGQGPASSRFRGVFYAGAGLEASELTLIGSLVTGNAATGTRLKRVNVLYKEPAGVGVMTGQIAKKPYMIGYLKEVENGLLYAYSFDEDRGQPGQKGSVHFTVAPKEGGYPCDVRAEDFRGGLLLETTLTDPQQVPGLQADLMQAVLDRAALEGSPIDFSPSFAEHLRTDLKGILVDPVTPGQISSAITLYGEISRFLPLEDKVRVVSWLES